jgi:UDP-glucose 4-epimerase
MGRLRCLVLGGAGFIGSHLVDALVLRGHQVRIFDVPNISTHNLERSLAAVEVVSGDFNNRQDLVGAMKGMDIIFHLVGSTLPGPSNENPAYDVESNVIGTLHLLEGAVQSKIRKIIFASSGGTVYGIPRCLPIPESHPTDPRCSYGITKLAIEKYLALYETLHRLDYTILRPGNPFGERQRINNVQGAVAVFLGRTLLGQPITIWGDGSAARDYFYISDLVAAFMSVAETSPPSRIYNIGSGHAHCLNDILTVIRKVTGLNPEVKYAPGRKLDVPMNCLDIRLAKKELGWQPEVSWEEGIERTWEWLKKSMKGMT